MRAQLDEMRSAAVQTARASRPYLLFESVAMTFNPTAEQMGLPGVPVQRQFLALFKFTNYGATPAIIEKESHAVAFPKLDKFSFSNMKDNIYALDYIIGSQKSTNLIREWQGFSLETWETFNGSGGNLYLSAIVIYQDVFGNRYETHVCFQVDVPFGTLTPRENGANCTNKRT